MKKHRMIAITVLWLTSAVFNAPAGMRFIELPTLGPDPTFPAWGRDINNAGTVVGGSVIMTNVLPGGVGFPHHAFRYENGVMTDLGTLPGGTPQQPYTSRANAINSAGLIVGYSQAGPAQLDIRAVKFVSGNVIDLGTLGGQTSCALGLNDNGEIVGWAARPDTTSHAFRYSELDGMVDLGALMPGLNSEAWDINDLGLVVGNADYATNEAGFALYCACVWENDQIRSLGTLGGSTGNAEGVNNAGVVVGSSLIPGDLACHAFRWTPETGMVALPPPAGALSSYAHDINRWGLIVGDLAIDGIMHAALYDPRLGTWIDLHALFFPQNYEGSFAYAINDQGWITGQASVGPRGVAWVLVPEPDAPGGPVITQAVMTAEGFVMRGTNGWPLAEYQVLCSTDITQPMTNWVAVATNIFFLDGSFACTNAIPDSPPQAFLRLRTAAP